MFHLVRTENLFPHAAQCKQAYKDDRSRKRLEVVTTGVVGCLVEFHSGRNKFKKSFAGITQMGRVLVAVIVSLWVIPLSLFVNRIVPEPYMDEIFHIPQTQQYCRGNFKSWDPMITTPPGLYYFSLAHVASLFPGMWYAKAVSSFSELCSTATLRSTNGVLAVICSVLIYEILTHLRPALDKRKATLYTIVLSMYPLHWFFTFLYYTDVASLSVVLAMYLACLKRHYRFSALLGAVAILVRQTNVVWMLLVACTGAINLTLPPNHKDNVQVNDHNVSLRKNEGLADKKSMARDPNFRKRKKGSSSDVGNRSIVELSDSSVYHPSGLFDEIQVILLRMWHLKLEVLVSFGPFVMVLLAFIMFVFWNGSVVLGAKEDHEVSQHFAQLMYFGLVSALAMAPLYFTFSQIAMLCHSFWKNRPPSFFLLFAILVVGFFSVHLCSIAHPYLLADNRHYTFYLWRKLTSHWSTKYLLLPLYAFSWFSIFDALGKVQRRIWVLAFSLACTAVLVPAPLIEFRYYTTPFYFLVLHSSWINVSDNRSWFLMGILYMAVNIFTITMFLFRTFEWKHEPGITQRFIW